MPLKDKLLLFALKSAVLDVIMTEVNGSKESAKAAAKPGDRQKLLPELVEVFKAMGSKSFDVALPDGGGTVATISLTIPTDKVEVTDLEAFAVWLADSEPDLVETTTIPATPAWDEVVHHPAIPGRHEFKVKKDALDRIQERGYKPAEEVLIHPETGEPVEGVTFTKAGDPEKFSLLFKKSTVGREAVLNAWQSGDLSGLRFQSILPAIERK